MVGSRVGGEIRVSEAFGFCIRDALKKNKYGTRTGVAELMCEQLGEDCSRKRLYIVCIFFQIGVRISLYFGIFSP